MDFTSVIFLCVSGLSLTSASCWNNSAHLHIEQLNPSIPKRNGQFSAEKVVTGPLYQLGDYSQCLYKFEAQYCLSDVQLTPADNSSQHWHRIQELNSIRANFRRDKLLVGICVPKQCSTLEMIDAFEESFSVAAQNTGIKATISVSDKDCQTTDSRPITTLDVTVGFVLGSIALLVLCGSYYDGMRRLRKCEDQVQKKGQRLLMCFSLFTNFQNMGSRSNTKRSENFQFIDLLRLFISYFALFLHNILWALSGPIQNPEWLEEIHRNNSLNLLMSTHVGVAIFLSISGFLTSYLFIRDRRDGRPFGMAGFLKNIRHRYARLTPAYAVMVALMATWFNHFGSGPMWNRFVGNEAENCRQNWWINLLYLNNYINVSTMCLDHTWYLAADFQCFVISMPVLVLVWKYPRFYKVTLSTVMILWVLVPFLQTYFERLDPTIILYLDTLKHFWQDKTLQRMYISLQGTAGPYFAGVIFGYIYYHVRGTAVKRTKLTYILFWSVSLTGIWIPSITGIIFYQSSYEYNVFIASLYACSYRTVLGITTGIFLTGMALGYGRIVNAVASWRPFQALGQLSYTIYLTHFYLQNLKAGAVKEPTYINYLTVISSSISDMIIATALALLLFLSVEMPFTSIMNEFIPSGDGRGQSKPESKGIMKRVHLDVAADENNGTNINIVDDSSTNRINLSQL